MEEMPQATPIIPVWLADYGINFNHGTASKVIYFNSSPDPRQSLSRAEGLARPLPNTYLDHIPWIVSALQGGTIPSG